MSAQQYYLKQNVLIEPLFNQWYAWSHLISPATAGMYVANLHLKIMQSFIANPQVHVSALKNPAMAGGPFINYDPSRVSEIAALMDRTQKERADMLKFAESITQVDEMLTNEANGFSLEPLYSKVPEMLRGYIELVYDLNNHPSMRVIERLLYRSPHYTESSQSLSLSLITKDDRSFIFSTPRLQGDDHVHLRMPFRSEQLDDLFKMKVEPNSVDYIKERLGVEKSSEELFSTFFTTEEPRRPEKFDGEGVRIRYLGHACILIETRDVTILFDPVISYKCENGVPRFTYEDLPEKIDYVLLTHNHQDHCMFETLLQLRHKVGQVIVPKNNCIGLVDPSLKLVIEQVGFSDVREIEELEEIAVEGGAITGLPFLGEHADLNITTKIAYHVRLKDRSIVCAADSNNIEPALYEHVHDIIGDVEVLFLGMECDGAPLTWLYGPLLTKPLARKMDQTRRFNGSDYERGMKIVNRLNPRHVYIYAMGQEPWLTYLTSIQYTERSRPIIESNKLVDDCQGRGLVSERLFGKKEIHLNGH